MEYARDAAVPSGCTQIVCILPYLQQIHMQRAGTRPRKIRTPLASNDDEKQLVRRHRKPVRMKACCLFARLHACLGNLKRVQPERPPPHAAACNLGCLDIRDTSTSTHRLFRSCRTRPRLSYAASGRDGGGTSHARGALPA